MTTDLCALDETDDFIDTLRGFIDNQAFFRLRKTSAIIETISPDQNVRNMPVQYLSRPP